ncbi:ABC-2 family transporter protein [compost metagenome]
MKLTILAFLKKPTTIVGIVTAVMFQLLFGVIWMTGYQGVTDNTKNLKFAIVNQDQGMGAKVVENLKRNFPFQTEVLQSMDMAQAALNERGFQMVIHIPADFTKQLQESGKKAPINYIINESNPTLIKSIMQGVAANITSTVNKEAVVSGTQAVLTKMNASLPQEQAGQIALGLADKVTSDIQYTNKVKDMSNQMLPMMMVLASIVGTMIMSMNFHTSYGLLGASSSKWGKFTSRLMVNVVAVVVISLIGSSLVIALGAHVDKGFITLWGFQTLCLLTFTLVAQMFLTIFGNAGMLFNIAMLSLQLVSSGAMVPRELLSDFYRNLSDFFPATYAVEGLMNILFGGPTAGSDAWTLLGISAIALAVSYIIIAIRKEKVYPLPAVTPAHPA